MTIHIFFGSFRAEYLCRKRGSRKTGTGIMMFVHHSGPIWISAQPFLLLWIDFHLLEADVLQTYLHYIIPLDCSGHPTQDGLCQFSFLRIWNWRTCRTVGKRVRGRESHGYVVRALSSVIWKLGKRWSRYTRNLRPQVVQLWLPVARWRLERRKADSHLMWNYSGIDWGIPMESTACSDCENQVNRCQRKMVLIDWL